MLCLYLKTIFLEYLTIFKDDSATRPDNTPPIFLNNCRNVLIKILNYLFNLSLSTVVFLIFGKNPSYPLSIYIYMVIKII